MRSPDAHVEDLLPDLLLGELAAPVAERALRHVAGCASCAVAWADLQAAAGQLADGAVPAPAPPAVRRRLMARAEADAARRHRRRRWLPAAGALAGAAAASLLWVVLRSSPTPGQRLAVLSGPHGMGGSVYMDTGLHRATIEVWRLPALPQGMVYEVWWSRGSHQMMGGSFGVDRLGDALATLTIPVGWQRATQVAITMEPAPGTARPTSAALIAGALVGSVAGATRA